MPIETWAGQAVNPLVEPWYRFSRVLEVAGPFIPLNPEISWLDVGCQMGQFLSCARSLYGVEALGIDDFAAADTVDVCRQYLSLEIDHPSEVLSGWAYYQRQIDKVGFSMNRQFDVVSGLEVIEHMVDTDGFIQECHSHLKPGGLLVLSTPNINSLRNRVMVPLGRYPAGMEHRTVIHHVRLYNAALLTEHVESFGFSRVALEGVTWLPVSGLGQGSYRHLDRFLSRQLPNFSGNLIAVFRKHDPDNPDIA